MTNTDHIRVPRRVEVINVAGEPEMADATATAELTISLMLDALRHGCTRQGPPRKELRDCVVHVWGLPDGRIATEVARLVQHHGARLAEPWALADVETLHIPLTSQTVGIVNSERIELFAPGAILVNTSRPGLVAEAAVIRHLKTGHLKIYATDFATCIDHPNIINTPHIGGWGQHSLEVACGVMWRKLVDRLGIEG